MTGRRAVNAKLRVDLFNALNRASTNAGQGWLLRDEVVDAVMPVIEAHIAATPCPCVCHTERGL